MKSTLASAEVKFLVQATEDGERVLKKVSEVFRIPIEKFEKSTLDGHFGNPITVFRVHLKGKNADNFASGMINLFEEDYKRTLLDEIPKSIDEHGSLYLRVDKQSIFSYRLVQSTIDAVRIKMKPRFKGPLTKMIDMFRMLLTK